MGNYELLIFEESVARHYYGQEFKLFSLFADYAKSTGLQRQLILNQITYITKPVPVLLLQKSLKKAFSKTKGYSTLNNTHTINYNGGAAKAVLTIDSDVLYLTSEGVGSNDLETMFFEVLRKCEPTFFAFSLDKNEYGWLRPFRQNVFLTPNLV